MAIADSIQERVKRLPRKRQQEVLDFVDILLSKGAEVENRKDELRLAHALLAAEMARLDDEEVEQGISYSLREIKARYR